MQQTNRRTGENFNKGFPSSHKRMSSLNAVHLNQVVKLTNQKFMSRSPDFTGVNNNHHSDKPAQRRSKSGIDGAFMHQDRMRKLTSLQNNHQPNNNFMQQQRTSLKSIGNRNHQLLE